VAASLQGIAQMFLGVGASNPCLNQHGNINFCLRCQFSSYTKHNSPPNCVKPISVPLLLHIAYIAQASHNLVHATIVDMTTIAFYFLLRPGEYTGTGATNTPFLLANVQLFSHGIRLSLTKASDATLQSGAYSIIQYLTKNIFQY